MSIDCEQYALDLDMDEYREDAKWKADTLLSIMPDGIRVNSILEIGCAAGLVMKQIGDKFGATRRVGIDISENMLKLARQEQPDATFIQRDINFRRFPEFDNNSFDVVILSDVLEHIYFHNDLLAEAFRIGKHVLMKIPAERTLLTRLDRRLRELMILDPHKLHNQEHAGGHVHFWTSDEIQEYIQRGNNNILGYKLAEPPTGIQFRGLRFRLRANPMYYALVVTRLVSWYLCRPFYRKLWATTVFAHCYTADHARFGTDTSPFTLPERKPAFGGRL